MRYAMLFCVLSVGALSGCTLGGLKKMVPLDRDLTAEEAVYAYKASRPPKSGNARVAGRLRWWFPVYASDDFIVVENSGILALSTGEFPGLLPHLSQWIGLSWGACASFVGNKLSPVALEHGTSWFGINPLIKITSGRGRSAEGAWEVELIKGFLAIGDSPESDKGGGTTVLFLWFIGSRNSFVETPSAGMRR
jgi:hypothetical protein